MTPEQIQWRAYRSGGPCDTCDYCAHYRDGTRFWRECRQDDPMKCPSVQHADGSEIDIDEEK